MKAPLCFAAAVLAAAPLRAQSFTGEFRALGIGAYTPRVMPEFGNQISRDERHGGVLAGGMWDISFITGRFRFGPEGFVLRGPSRRVWSLGGVARYEFGDRGVRPFGLVSAGAYFWDYEFVPDYQSSGTWGSDVSLLSAGAGGGFTFGKPGARLTGTAELRIHRNLQTEEQMGSRVLLSVGVGARVSW